MDRYSNQDIIRAFSNAAAAHAEDYGEEGDFAHEHLLNPTIFALLGEVHGKRILDAGKAICVGCWPDVERS